MNAFPSLWQKCQLRLRTEKILVNDSHTPLLLGDVDTAVTVLLYKKCLLELREGCWQGSSTGPCCSDRTAKQSRREAWGQREVCGAGVSQGCYGTGDGGMPGTARPCPPPLPHYHPPDARLRLGRVAPLRQITLLSRVLSCSLPATCLAINPRCLTLLIADELSTRLKYAVLGQEALAGQGSLGQFDRKADTGFLEHYLPGVIKERAWTSS